MQWNFKLVITILASEPRNLLNKNMNFHDIKLFVLSISLYEDDFDEDEDLPEGDIMALKGLENDDELDSNKNKPWTMVTGIDDDIDDNDDDDDDDDFY